MLPRSPTRFVKDKVNDFNGTAAVSMKTLPIASGRLQFSPSASSNNMKYEFYE